MKDGGVVVPASVPDGEPVSCPTCGETMYARGGKDRARHFYHNTPRGGGGGCSLASESESSTHARCVALAVAALQEEFESQASKCGAEIQIDVSGSGSGNQTRRVDSLLEFESENPFFGKGLIIEVQHQHEEKDIQETTHDYLSAGYSVVWLSSQDFGEERLDYSIVDKKFERDIEARHYEERENYAGYSVRHNSPESFLNCEAYFYSGEHNWRTVPSYILTCEEEYEICIGQGCTLRHKYDEDRSEYVYNPDSITTPDLPLRVLRDTVILRYADDRPWASSDVSTPTIKSRLESRHHSATLEKTIASRPEIDECPGSKEFHEWQSSQSLWEGASKVELHACQHCATHLLADLRGYEDERTDILFNEKPNPEWDLLSLTANPRQCQHRSHNEQECFESCPECGVTNPM